MPDINSLNDILDLIYKLGEFFIGTIVIKYIIVKWVAEQCKVLFKKLFLRTERDLALFIHYQNKARQRVK